jgi:hypothetical protein
MLKTLENWKCSWYGTVRDASSRISDSGSDRRSIFVVNHHTHIASKPKSQYEAMIDLRTAGVSNETRDGMRRLMLPRLLLPFCPLRHGLVAHFTAVLWLENAVRP